MDPDSQRDATCRHCRRFVDDPRALERELAGLNILGSAFASVRGSAGICTEHDRFMDPIPAADCSAFTPRGEHARAPRGGKRTSRLRKAILLSLAVAVLGWLATGPNREGAAAMAFTLSSSSFAESGEIPERHTCEGSDISPHLVWSGAPEGTRSFALIVDDPDAPDPKAPRMTWVHWVLYDLPAGASSLPEGVASADLPAGTREGLNDWKRTGYGGPCPPIGRHRYFHNLYALDTTLGDLERATKKQLEAAMAGHVLATAQLVGTYQKRR